MLEHLNLLMGEPFKNYYDSIPLLKNIVNQIYGCFVKKIAPKQLFYSFPASGKFNASEIKAAMKRAADEKSVLVFYAHNITEEIPPTHHIAFSQLEELLEYAKSINLSVRGFNEL